MGVTEAASAEMKSNFTKLFASSDSSVPKPETRNPTPDTRNSKPEIRNTKLVIRNPKLETRKSKPGTRDRNPGRVGLALSQCVGALQFGVPGLLSDGSVPQTQHVNLDPACQFDLEHRILQERGPHQF